MSTTIEQQRDTIRQEKVTEIHLTVPPYTHGLCGKVRDRPVRHDGRVEEATCVVCRDLQGLS